MGDLAQPDNRAVKPTARVASTALRRDLLPAFKKWLEATGWELNGTLGKVELIRASRSSGRQHLFVYDRADKDTLMLFDIASREAKRFLREVKP